MLSSGRLRELLEYEPETGLFFWKIFRGGSAYAGTRAGTLDDTGYISILIEGKRLKAHRVAWLYVYGEWPCRDLDHINGNRADNSIFNLREVTQLQNNWNRKKNAVTKSGYKGVSWRARCKKWKARIRVNGRLRELGNYDTPEKAHAAYAAAAREFFGEYARTA